jgi:hypothetical protein
MVCELCAKTIAKGSNSVQVNYGGYPFAAHYLCFFSRVNGSGSGEQAPRENQRKSLIEFADTGIDAFYDLSESLIVSWKFCQRHAGMEQMLTRPPDCLTAPA